jgi:large repetitive protein
MRQFQHRSWRRSRPLVAAIGLLVLPLAGVLGDASVAAATPAAGYTTSLILTGQTDSVAVDPDTDTVYFGSVSGDGLTVVDASTNTVTGTIGLPASSGGVAADPATDTVYVSVAATASSPPAVDVIDGATNTVTDTIPLPTGSDPAGVAVDSSTDTVYVAEYDAAAVAVIAGSTNSVTTTVSTGTEPYSVAIDESTDVIWVGEMAGDVLAISGTSNSVAATISPGGGAVPSVAVNPDTDTVYAATEAGGVAVIDGATGTITTNISVTTTLYAVAVDPGSGTVFASSYDGASLMGTTWVIDDTTNTITDTLERGGYQAAVDTATGSVYEAGYVALPVDAWVLTPSAANDMSPVITSQAGVTFVTGGDNSFDVTASALPAATYTETGQLPTGVGLSSSGILSGNPAADSGGTYPITITASNGVAPGYSQAFTLTIAEVPIITIPSSATVQVGTAVSIPIEVTGSPAATSVGIYESAPTGLAVTEPAQGSWALTGTPAAGSAGLYDTIIDATNANGTSFATIDITVEQPPTITSADQAIFTEGVAGSFTVTASGYPAPTFTETGTLPAGVTLASNGVLSGTPALGTAGVYPITLTASNGVAPEASVSFTLTVAQPYEVQASQQSGYCLDNTGGSSADSNPIQIWSCLGNANQGWLYVPSVNGVAGDYQLENSNGSCLDDPGDSKVNGTKVQLWSCLGDASQQWTAVAADGIFTEYVNANGLCLDNSGNATVDGNRVQVWACNGDAAQHWYGPSSQSSIIPPVSEVRASQASGFCLDNTDGLAVDGNPIQIWSCLGNADQGWKYVPSVNGVTGDYQLENSNGLCLDDPGDSIRNGTKVQLWSCLGDASQTWTQATVGDYVEYVNTANGLCLDNTGDALTDGNRVQVWDCNGDLAQQWAGPSADSGTASA